jgi:hypothetical protein
MKMSTICHFSKLKKGMINIQALPVFESILTGVQRITQSKDGKITLVYTDLSEESAMSKKDLCTEFTNTVEVIEFVQNRYQ